MELKNIDSYRALRLALKDNDRTFLLLYKGGSENSECARGHFEQAAQGIEHQTLLMLADVNQVRDIHPQYGITSAPTVLEFQQTRFIRSVKGCQSPEYYKSLINNTLYVSRQEDQPSAPRVIVYSTPSCPHCNSLKNYLRQIQMPFRDIDVSRDQKMAQELVKKSGQQGVPQTEINGRIVVGFNKSKINQMLGIQ